MQKLIFSAITIALSGFLPASASAADLEEGYEYRQRIQRAPVVERRYEPDYYVDNDYYYDGPRYRRAYYYPYYGFYRAPWVHRRHHFYRTHGYGRW